MFDRVCFCPLLVVAGGFIYSLALSAQKHYRPACNFQSSSALCVGLLLLLFCRHIPPGCDRGGRERPPTLVFFCGKEKGCQRQVTITPRAPTIERWRCNLACSSFYKY
nr:hypothetical protein [Pandoravirus massiliensis]